MRGDDVIGLVATVLLCSLPIVWLVFHFLHSLVTTLAHIRLKREMVLRGYSAQEIIDVVRARSSGRKGKASWHDVPPAKPVLQPAPQPYG